MVATRIELHTCWWRLVSVSIFHHGVTKEYTDMQRFQDEEKIFERQHKKKTDEDGNGATKIFHCKTCRNSLGEFLQVLRGFSFFASLSHFSSSGGLGRETACPVPAVEKLRFLGLARSLNHLLEPYSYRC